MPQRPSSRALNPRARPGFRIAFVVVIVAAFAIVAVIALRGEPPGLPARPAGSADGVAVTPSSPRDAEPTAPTPAPAEVLASAAQPPPPRPPRPEPSSPDGRIARYRDLLATIDIGLHGIRFVWPATAYSKPVWPAWIKVEAMTARLTAIAALARGAKPATPLDRAVLAYVAVIVADLPLWQSMYATAEQDPDEPAPKPVDRDALFERFGAASHALRTVMPAAQGTGLEAAMATCRAAGDVIARMTHAPPQAERAAVSVYEPRPGPEILTKLGHACFQAILAADATEPVRMAELQDVSYVRQYLIGEGQATLDLRDALRKSGVPYVPHYAQISNYATDYYEQWRDKP